ncbi:uncharacterized protein LOC142590977 [Dermacentor variabilis]|uniref:uncharacterized protein LOC142590977 n=1 Tax=Dermacentor variabilis TaxID=34621 RepID=UPI003F5B7737
MECRLNLGVVLLACLVLQAQASIVDILKRHFGKEDMCDKLRNRLKTCLNGLEGLEVRYFKNRLRYQGTQDQLMGCVRRRLVEAHIVTICDGNNSEEILVGCVNTSLRDHVSPMVRWRVAKFANKIKVCFGKYKGKDESRREGAYMPIDDDDLLETSQVTDAPDDSLD